MIKISVITVAYKNSKVVVDLLNSIHKYNDIGDALEVIVVDNSPEDCRIEEAIKVTEYKGHMYIPADNRGFGAGNNIGAKVAKGEILAFLNPDIILVEPIFKKILQKYAVDDKLVWIGGQLLNIAGGRNYSFGYRFECSNFTLIESLQVRLNEYLQRFDSKSMYLTGADIFIRKKIFDDIGRFDEKFFMYYEEPDLIHRITKKCPDAVIKFCPDIRMIHLEGRSTDVVSANSIRINFESSLYYCKKYGFDASEIYRRMYSSWKRKLLIDSFIRPQMAIWRKQYLQEIEKLLGRDIFC